MARPCTSGAFDAYVVSALDSVLRQKRFAAANIRTTGKLGDGSFGVVYEAVESVTGRELVVKQAKSVQGATELQNAEVGELHGSCIGTDTV